eukprot:1684373-Rhodomonas_salina.2
MREKEGKSIEESKGGRGAGWRERERGRGRGRGREGGGGRGVSEDEEGGTGTRLAIVSIMRGSSGVENVQGSVEQALSSFLFFNSSRPAEDVEGGAGRERDPPVCFFHTA